MLIDERLKKIKPYLVSLRYDGKTSIIDVQFKKDWVVPQDSKNIKITKYAELPNTYMFYSDNEDTVMDDIANYVSQIVEINQEREEKILLLRAKIAELQEFFVNNELADLKLMEFTIPTKPKSLEAYKWDNHSTDEYTPVDASEIKAPESDEVIDSDFNDVEDVPFPEQVKEKSGE